jgi:hypothetical protein
MRISSDLFNAFLKCATKCWLRATGEPALGNPYAEWMKSENRSYHLREIERILSETPKNDVAVSPALENLKAAKWRLAVNLAVSARMDTCILESEVHAVERAPCEGRGKPPQFIPVRSRNSSNTVIPRGIWTEFAITLGGFAEYRDPQPQTRTEVA